MLSLKKILDKGPLAKFLVLTLFTFGAKAQTIDPPVIEEIGPNTELKVVPPTNTFYGTRGLSQTNSAEALGEGRLIFGFSGSWYQQQRNFSGVPNKDANIFAGIGSAAIGVNRQIDAFVSLTGFGSTDYESSDAAGIGSLGGGIQGTLPFEPSTPVRMAAQVGIFQGFSKNQIDSNKADGYNYFETRTGLDFTAKLIQSLVLGSEDLGFKFHANEGLVTSGESGTDALLLLGAGAQMNLFTTVVGLEMHSRTPIKEIDIGKDPLWITPSVQLRTPYSMNVILGGDIALSQDRDDAINSRPLEPYRLFAGLNFTFDTEASKRQEIKDRERREAAEKKRLKMSNMELSSSLVKQAYDDSVARAEQQAQADSAAARAQQDSASMAEKARQDSLALAESQRNLADEKSKRSEAEKQLLSTGLLLLDAVYFETGKTAISINSKPYLNIIAKMLAKYPKLQIEVAGHTDNVGSDATNQALSQGRAEAVAIYMVEAAPELRNVLTARGYGESMPKADNQSAEGRLRNRRTELQVTNKEALQEYNK